jgi:hypothetical protein
MLESESAQRETCKAEGSADRRSKNARKDALKNVLSVFEQLATVRVPRGQVHCSDGFERVAGGYAQRREDGPGSG